jgi:alpha-galactosidase
VLDGDDLTRIAPARLAILKRLLPPGGRAAQFEDDNLSLGVTKLGDGGVVYALFNWGDTPADRTVTFPARCRLKNYWSGEDLGQHEQSYSLQVAGRSAMLLHASPVS